MMRKRKESEVEKMTPANIKKVIAGLEAETNKLTKKDACAMLGMSYNTSRLDSIIKTFKEKATREKELRAAKARTPIQQDEVEYILKEYLSKEPLSNIANSLHRNTNLVKRVLEQYGVPIRSNGEHSYFKPHFIPDEAVKDSFALNEIVFSARYDCLAEIRDEQPHKVYGKVYRIWLLGEEQFAYQPACELASTSHLPIKLSNGISNRV